MEFLSEGAVEIPRCFGSELVEICLWGGCG